MLKPWKLSLLLASVLVLAASARADVTFVAASDTHFVAADAKNDRKRTILNAINDIAGKKFPQSLGNVAIGKPRGLLIAGDLIDGGREVPAQWAAWQRDFGLTGTDGAVLKIPVYETWGNHDGGNPLVANAIVARNKNRVALTAVSPENNGQGLNYSWDFGPLHLVTVGFYPGNANESKKHGAKNYDPRHSLDFLIKDLAANVGDTKRPVLIMQHHNMPNDSEEWWTKDQRAAFAEAIKNYNVVAIVDGHEAGGLYKWNGIDILGCNDIASGFWVVQISDQGKMIAARTLDGSSWHPRTLNKTINLGAPTVSGKTTVAPAATQPAAAAPEPAAP